jgi:hypothetical protein
MGLLDKKAADWTARDALHVWVLTGILDIFKILTVIPLFFRPKKATRTKEEILQAQRDDHLDFTGR